ncbi:ankyrin, partial [Lindgomyces ingoldianus]
YVYCDWQQSRLQSTVNLLGSLTRQIAESEADILPLVKSLHADHQDGKSRLTASEQVKLLQHLLGREKRVFLIIDGLDECNHDSNVSGGTKMARIESTMIGLLDVQHAKGQSHLSVLISSRFEQQPDAAGDLFRHVKVKAETHDISDFIYHELSDVQNSASWTNPSLARSLQRNPKRLEEITNECTSQACNTFLLAHLHIITLKSQLSVKSLAKAVRNLPPSLDTAVNDALIRIKEQTPLLQDLGLRVLVWLSSVRRPLTLVELQHAIGTDEGDIEWNDDGLIPADILLSSCAGLAEIDHRTNIIALVHVSIKEILDMHHPDLLANKDLMISKICLTYLNFSEFRSEQHPNHDRIAEWEYNRPFLAYAAQNWGIHAKVAPEPAALSNIIRTLRNESIAGTCFSMMYGTTWNTVDSCPQNVSRCHLAAFFGLNRTLSTLLDSGINVDIYDEYKRTPLYMAASRGHTDSVKLLLSRKATVSGRHGPGSDCDDSGMPLRWWMPPWARDDWRGSAIEAAAEMGYKSIVEILTDSGASLSHSSGIHGSPLEAAVFNGHVDLVSWILQRTYTQKAFTGDHDEGLNLSHYGLPTPLTFNAAVLGEYSPDKHGSALQAAAFSGHDEMVGLLIKSGAEVNFYGGWYGTALQAAAVGGNLAVVKRLIAQGAHINTLTGFHGNPLSAAASRGHLDIVNYLLSKGAAPNARGGEYGFALTAASRNGSPLIVRALLAAGAEPNCHGGRYGHAAQAACIGVP